MSDYKLDSSERSVNTVLVKHPLVPYPMVVFYVDQFCLNSFRNHNCIISCYLSLSGQELSFWDCLCYVHGA